jgi:hypothetical protein
MAKKNFKGVPDDYATNPYPGWGVPIPQEAVGICEICGVDHGKLVEHNPYTAPTNPMSLKQIDKLLKDTYGKPYYVPPVDPVLIKATVYKPSFFESPPIVESMPIKQMRVEVRPEIPGYSSQKNGFKKHGFAWALSGWEDITESQLRKMLMDGFMKITDDIVNQIKEQNK